MKVTQNITPASGRWPWATYLLAVVLTGVTLLVRMAIGDRFEGPTMIVFAIPIILGAYWGGLGPGLLATALSALGAAYFIFPPIFSFNVLSPDHRWQEATLVLTGTVLSVICEALHRSHRRLEANLAVVERTREELRVALKNTGDLRAALDEHANVAITDPHGKITFVNDKFCAIAQYSRAELIGQDHRLINSGFHSKEFIRDLWTTIASGKVWHGEIKNKARDGSFYWGDTTIIPFLDEGGKPLQYVAIRADITARKQHEHEVARLTRLYAALSHVNQAIVWLRSSDELFRKVCRVLVEDGGFHMAWIGWHDPATHQLLPVASWGDDKGYLKSIKIFSDADRPEGCGPSGTAFREGRPNICNDLLHDASALPWRTEARQRGLQASAVFPIRENGRVCSVLNVYADEAGFFQEREIALLTEAAVDVSFALDNLAREAARSRAELEAAQLVAIVQTSDDAIIGKNLAGIVTSWNAGAEHIFGFTAQEMVGQPILRLIPPDRLPEEMEILACMRRGEGIRHRDTLRVRKDGRLVDVSITTSVIRDAAGNIIGASKVARDITERKSAEAALRESEELFSTAFRLSPDCVTITRLSDRVIIRANEALCALWGSTPGQVIGQLSREHSNWLNEDERLGFIRTLEQNGECLNHEAILRLSDGRLLDFNISSRMITFSGEPCVLTVLHDITERKQAEEKLLESQALYHSFVEQLPNAVFRKDADGCYVMVNAEFCRLKGVNAGDFLGRQPGEVSQIESAQQAAGGQAFKYVAQAVEIHRQIMQTGKRVETEEEFPGVDGGKQFMHVVRMPVFGLDHKIVGTQGIMFDITERKRAEAALQEGEERFRTMANSIPQLAWIAQADGFINWYNQRWYEYTGTTPEQMEGWGWQGVHDPEMLPAIVESWKSALASGTAWEMQFPLRRADGTFRTFLTRVQPLKNSAGQVTQWFGTNTDVEELKQAEEKIQELNTALERRVIERTAQLETANKELESFSYSISHDLRAPLRGMNGFAAIMLEQFGPQLTAEGRHYLDRIRNAGQRMGELIDDLLAFSRLGRQSMSRRVVDANQLVLSALEELEPQRAGRQIKLNIGELPASQGDSGLLKQVWVNLIGNAIKYTGGRTLAVIEIGCEDHDGETIFFVRDNGAGFDMKYAHKLFAVFQRLHRADEFEGTGVGLAIVQRIVQRHGGRIWAEAEEGRGAIFRFTLGKETRL